MVLIEVWVQVLLSALSRVFNMICPGCDYPIVYGGFCECKYMNNVVEETVWDAIVHYLYKCNKCGASLHRLVLDVAADKTVTYSIVRQELCKNDEVLFSGKSLEEVAASMKVYTSWEDD
jgi:hypothetical protein